MSFFRKLNHFLLIGIVTILLLTLGQQLVSAEGDNTNCDDSNQWSCPEGGGQVSPGVPTPTLPSQPAPSCSLTDTDYPQCGGDCLNGSFASNHTIMVHRRVTNACTYNYTCDDLGVRIGECGNTTPAPSNPVPANPTPANPVPAQPSYGPLNPTASAVCSNGMENISANWSGNGAASYNVTLAVNGNTIASACSGSTSYTFGNYPHRTDSSYIVTIFPYKGANCSGDLAGSSNSYGVSQVCPNPAPTPQPPAGAPTAPLTPSPSQSLACPVPGQFGTRLLNGCLDGNGNTQYGYDSCSIASYFSNGSVESYRCSYSGNNQCQGVIHCSPPQTIYNPPVNNPPVNQCRSITCPSAPANYYYSGQLTYTCDPSVALTCGTLIATVTNNPTCSIIANPQSGNSPLNVSFTGNGYTAAGKTINSYSWDLDGNGSYGDATSQTASRVYNSSTGVGLQVIDSNGQTGYCNTTVNINAAQYTATTATYQNVGVGTQPVYVKELPKTGLPALAWAIGAFIPAGLGLKRFNKVKKELDSNGNYLWENRQYLRS